MMKSRQFDVPCLRLAPELPPMDEIIAYNRGLTKKNLADFLAQAEAEGRVLVQPRCGVGDHAEMIDILHVLNRQGRADCLTLTIDSHTRLKNFETAARLSRESPSQLNGYPLVAHGYRKVSVLNELFEKPIQVRHGSPDGRRLFAETIAAGIQAFEGGGISYNLPYCRYVSLKSSLDAWREVDEACGQFAEAGIVIDREFFGSLTGVLVPPAIALAVIFLEAILAVRAGCRCLSLAYPQNGNIAQDIAALRTIRTLSRQYLPDSVQAYPVLHQFMGIFPQDREQSETLIFFGGLTAKMGGATKVVNKTYQEAVGLPDADANAAGIRRTRLSFEDYISNLIIENGCVEEEAYWIERETRELIDPILQEPDLRTAIVRAFHNGRLDIPFPANDEAHGNVIPFRSPNAAVYYAKTGNLTFSNPVKRRNERLLTQFGYDRLSLHSLVSQSIMYFSDEGKNQG